MLDILSLKISNSPRILECIITKHTTHSPFLMIKKKFDRIFAPIKQCKYLKNYAEFFHTGHVPRARGMQPPSLYSFKIFPTLRGGEILSILLSAKFLLPSRRAMCRRRCLHFSLERRIFRPAKLISSNKGIHQWL